MDLFTLSFSNVITFLTWQIWLCIVHARRKRWCIKLISVSFMLYKKISKFLWPILDLSVIRDPNHTGCFFIHHLCTYQHYYSHTRQWNQGWRGDVGVTYWPNIIHPKYHFSPVHRYIKLSTHKIIHEIDDYTRNRRRGYTGEKCYLTRIGLCHRCLRTQPICDLIYSFIAKNYLKQTFYEKKL